MDKPDTSQLEKAILAEIEANGLEAAENRFLNDKLAMSPEGQTIKRVFVRLHQDQEGKGWRFRKGG